MSAPRIGISFSISVENAAVFAAMDIDQARGAMQEIARDAAVLAKGLWLQHAQTLRIRGSGQYLQGIQDAEIREVTRGTGDDLSFTMEIENTAPHAAIVEDGHAAFHLPDRINWSGAKVKHSKDGTPYLNIPFRHSAYQGQGKAGRGGMTLGTRKAMLPPDIHAAAKGLAPTIRHNAGPQFHPDGRYRAADRYTWGGRIQTDQQANFVAGRGGSYENRRSERTVGRDASGRMLTNPAWQTSRFDGLFRSGTEEHSEYVTIRTITPNSQGWNIPAQMGHGVARHVASMLNSGAGQAEFDAIVSARLQGVLP